MQKPIFHSLLKKRALIINVTTSTNIFVGAFFSNRDMTGHETFRNADSASPVFFYWTISVSIDRPMTQHSAYTPCLHGYPRCLSSTAHLHSKQIYGMQIKNNVHENKEYENDKKNCLGIS